jgi:hypothetical protein
MRVDEEADLGREATSRGSETLSHSPVGLNQWPLTGLYSLWHPLPLSSIAAQSTAGKRMIGTSHGAIDHLQSVWQGPALVQGVHDLTAGSRRSPLCSDQ